MRLIFVALILGFLTLGGCGEADEPSVCESAYECVLNAGCRDPNTTQVRRDLDECEATYGVLAAECEELQTQYDDERGEYVASCWRPCTDPYADASTQAQDDALAAGHEAEACLHHQLVPEAERVFFDAETLARWEAGCAFTCEADAD